MKLGLKELHALEWLSEQADLGLLDVAIVRDQADVGWLEVFMKQQRQQGMPSHRRSMLKYRVSPLGHVYDESGTVVRKGPAVGPDGEQRQTRRTVKATN